MPFNIAVVEIAPDEMCEKSVDLAAPKKGAIVGAVAVPHDQREAAITAPYEPAKPQSHGVRTCIKPWSVQTHGLASPITIK